MSDPFGDSSLFDAFTEEAPPPVEVKKRKVGAAQPQSKKSKIEKVAKKEEEEEEEVEDVKSQKKENKSKTALEVNFGEFVEQKVQVVPAPGDRCTAEVCYPPRWDFVKEEIDKKLWAERPKPKPAKEYPFQLDAFQRQSIECLEKGQSVLVAAHTSAGKTVVAEYAIAMSLRDKQRVIYTSPIKALSNQKYRELYEEFQDVGLMTGDITINPSASCLVMTTEILRNMLYRGSEVMREVAWVIFDEIHYMRDKDRGVVWEETIIMLPHRVHFVFLSATIPNAREFALWIAKLHEQPCNVVYTDFRPTPLQHYIFPAGGDGLYLVVDEKENFKEQNFQKALAILNQKDSERDLDKKKKKKGAQSEIFKIIKLIMDRQYYPVIVFSFSKRDCEAHALSLSKLDFCDPTEKKLIEQIYQNAIDSLSDDDKKLPQVEHILPMLMRGIGIHHGGLLPILKEVIEILFQEGLIKCLFSTETFSMGLNMPARTVVFTSVKKWDGEAFRVLGGGEYIQMSGRAGRRGLDDRGIVILMMDELLDPNAARMMVKGSPDPLNSAFHLGYNMLLNLLRVEGADPEYIMARSFHQFQQVRMVPKLKTKLDDLQKAYDDIVITNPKAMADYHHLRTQLEIQRKQMLEVIRKPSNILTFLNPGRLIHIKEEIIPKKQSEVGDVTDLEAKLKIQGTQVLDFGWGIIINFQKKKMFQPKNKAGKSIDGAGETYLVDVLLKCASDTDLALGAKALPAKVGDKGQLVVLPCILSSVYALSSIRVHIPKDLRDEHSRTVAWKNLTETIKRFPQGPALLDPVEDMNIKDDGFVDIVRKIENLEDKLTTHQLHKSKDIKEQYNLFAQRLDLESQINALQGVIRSATTDVVMKQKLKSMKVVLRRLGHVQDGVITMKGRVACEISTCDELLATELMFGGAFSELDSPQLAAICSCLVFNEKADAVSKLKEELAGPLRQLQESARRIAQVINDAKIQLDIEEYVDQFHPNLMDVVYAWCQGSKFSEIISMTDVFEGTIIRCMRRLEELLRQCAAAAKSVGNTPMEEKFLQTIEKLKRDIVFAASLYL